MWCRHIIQNFRGRQRNLKGCFKSMSNHIRSRLFWRCTLFSKNIWVIFFSIHFFCFHFPLHAKTIGFLYYIIRRLYLITIQYMRIVDKIEKLSVWVLAVKNYMKIDRGHVSDIQYREI